jgi:PBP1b-binding outer membrane lipoprotein LpoB
MSKTKAFLTRRTGVAMLLGLLLLLALVLAGCGGEPTAAPPEPTEVAAVTSEPTAAPTEPPTPTDIPTEPPPTDTPLPTDTPTPEPIDDSGCITCHTDEETLKALATEEEAPEVESEGEG